MSLQLEIVDAHEFSLGERSISDLLFLKAMSHISQVSWKRSKS